MQVLLTEKEIEIVLTMRKSGVFDIGYGKATLNFMNKDLQNVVIEEIKWKK